MPARQCLLRTGTDSDREDVISGQFGLAQRSEHVCSCQQLHGKTTKTTHTFICKVVAHAENKLRRIVATLAVVLYKRLRDLALVYEPRADLQVGFARHNLDVVLLCHSPLEMLLALARLERAVFGIGSAVVPCQGNLLAFDEGACCLLVLHHWVIGVKDLP
jgi:hypothetical protein